ncbi:unnamed protein product, partial [Symbiodinium necroappetens]
METSAGHQNEQALFVFTAAMPSMCWQELVQLHGCVQEVPYLHRPERRPSQGIPQPPLLQDPFRPGFLGDRPIWWMPEGGLLGPRHPAWGQVAPGRSGGMMPRFDVIGPGEPDPDHFVCSPESGESGLVEFQDSRVQGFLPSTVDGPAAEDRGWTPMESSSC